MLSPSPDRVFEALGDSTRRRILELLGDQTRSVSALQQPLGISLAGVVQHVKVLESSGLLNTEKVGRVRFCRISHDGLIVASSWIAERKVQFERKLDRLDELLAED